LNRKKKKKKNLILFFFYIGKRDYIKKEPMSAQNMHSMASSYKIDEETESECKETTKSATLLTVEKPHTLDQLNKEVANFSMS
jgi:hypothetical protein